MHPHPPCSDALMSNKTQIDSKPPRGGVDQDVVVIETRITCSVFPLTLHLSASEHAAIDGTWTPIPIDLSGWNQYILSAHARPSGRHAIGDDACRGGRNMAGAKQICGRYNLSVGGLKGLKVVERLMAERLQTTSC